MKIISDLENSLEKPMKDLPALPKGFRDFLVKIVPWLALIGGIFGVISAWNIYRWTTIGDDYVDLANEISRAYGGTTITNNSWSMFLYLAVGVLLVTSIIYIMAFSPLKNYQKKGWDLLFIALLLNLAYGVVLLFTDYGGFSNFIGTLIGSAIGVYLLFQLRDYYIGKAKVNSATPPPKEGKPASKK